MSDLFELAYEQIKRLREWVCRSTCRELGRTLKSYRYVR